MLEIKNIYSGYGKTCVVEDVTATFKKGKLTCIIGVNGCGKSTLLKAMLGIIPLFSGEITLDGQQLSLMSRNEIAKKVAYLAQGNATPDMTVEQMVLHGRFPYLSYPRRYTSMDREFAQRAMEKVGIAELALKPLYTLSGGMRQNAYIAMALAQDTDYILLDEPTAFLDVANRFQLMNTLKQLSTDGKGVVAVLHDIGLALKYADKIVLMQNGRIVTDVGDDEKCLIRKIEDTFNVSIERIEGKTGVHYCIAENNSRQ